MRRDAYPGPGVIGCAQKSTRAPAHRAARPRETARHRRSAASPKSASHRASRLFENRFEDRCQVAGRAVDHLQHFGDRGLLRPAPRRARPCALRVPVEVPLLSPWDQLVGRPASPGPTPEPLYRTIRPCPVSYQQQCAEARPPPPCPIKDPVRDFRRPDPRGYLIGWVINPDLYRPIRYLHAALVFDGDAWSRGRDSVRTKPCLSQADRALPSGERFLILLTLDGRLNQPV